MTSVSFEPLIPASLFAFLALAAVVLLVVYSMSRPSTMPKRRWFTSIALMSAGVALVLVVLLNPILVRHLPGPPGKPLITLLVDNSMSMLTTDIAGSRTRYSSAAQSAQRISNRLSDRFEVQVRTFAEQSLPADPGSLEQNAPNGATTDLSAAISASMQQERPQGQAMVLLSDGIDTAGGAARALEAAHLAKAMALPVYTRTIGGEINTIDLSIAPRSPQDLAFLGQKVPVSVQIKQIGASAGKTVVHLMRGGEEVARREIEISPAAGSEVSFLVSQDRIGLYPYELRIDPIPGEVTSANNSASYLLRVVDEPIRVLALEGKPYWDSKFLARTLSSDPAIALDIVTMVADKRFVRRTFSRRDDASDKPATAASNSTAAVPPRRMETWKVATDASDILTSGDGLKGYQIVVLGRDSEAFLNDAAVTNLQNWIARDGGSLVCYRGSPTSQVNQTLAKLLPVQWARSTETRFRVKLTEGGRGMNWWPARASENSGSAEGVTDALAALPALVRSDLVDQVKPLAVVLATAQVSATNNDPTATAQAPALVYHQYGTGRVVVIEGAGMWRWAFLPPEHQQREDAYRGLWQSLLRWLTSGESLTPGQKITLRADKVNFMSSEPATATLLAREDVTRGRLPQISLTSAGDSNAATFAPVPLGDEIGTYRVDFGKLADGRYTARIVGSEASDASAEAVFEVRSFSAEQIDLRARPDLMQQIATASGGNVLASDDIGGEIVKSFGDYLTRTRPVQVERVSAWDRGWILLAIFGVWGLCWLSRRSSGLV